MNPPVGMSQYQWAKVRTAVIAASEGVCALCGRWPLATRYPAGERGGGWVTLPPQVGATVTVEEKLSPVDLEAIACVRSDRDTASGSDKVSGLRPPSGLTLRRGPVASGIMHCAIRSGHTPSAGR